MSFKNLTLEDRRSNGAQFKRRNVSKNIILKVVVLGDTGVGKSCIMNRFVWNQFGMLFPTVGVDFLSKDLEICGEAYTLQIWDTAGQERFKSLRTPFYRGSDICLLTYAVDDRDSFENISVWHREFFSYAGVKEGSPFPFVVVGNKADVDAVNRKVTQEEAKAWCEEHGDLPFLETSAKNAVNIESAFRLAVEQWAQYEGNMGRQYESERIDLHSGHSFKNKSCCVHSKRSLAS